VSVDYSEKIYRSTQRFRDSLLLGLVKFSDALDLVEVVSSDGSNAVVERAKVEVLVQLEG